MDELRQYYLRRILPRPAHGDNPAHETTVLVSPLVAALLIAVTGTRGTADITPHVLVFVLGG